MQVSSSSNEVAFVSVRRPIYVEPGLVPAELSPFNVPDGACSSHRVAAGDLALPPAIVVGRTTLVLRNLAPKCTKNGILAELWSLGLDADFVHVLQSYKTKLCNGVAYVNFIVAECADVARQRWQGRAVFAQHPCSNGLNVVWADEQGFDRCVLRCHNKYCKDMSLRPWVAPHKEERRAFLLQPEVRSLLLGVLGERRSLRSRGSFSFVLGPS